MKKQTASNNPFLAKVKRAMNHKVFAEATRLVNAGDEQAARLFVSKFFGSLKNNSLDETLDNFIAALDNAQATAETALIPDPANLQAKVEEFEVFGLNENEGVFIKPIPNTDDIEILLTCKHLARVYSWQPPFNPSPDGAFCHTCQKAQPYDIVTRARFSEMCEKGTAVAAPTVTITTYFYGGQLGKMFRDGQARCPEHTSDIDFESVERTETKETTDPEFDCYRCHVNENIRIDAASGAFDE
jgi:hypothetical protein